MTTGPVLYAVFLGPRQRRGRSVLRETEDTFTGGRSPQMKPRTPLLARDHCGVKPLAPLRAENSRIEACFSLQRRSWFQSGLIGAPQTCQRFHCDPDGCEQRRQQFRRWLIVSRHRHRLWRRPRWFRLTRMSLQLREKIRPASSACVENAKLFAQRASNRSKQRDFAALGEFFRGERRLVGLLGEFFRGACPNGCRRANFVAG